MRDQSISIPGTMFLRWWMKSENFVSARKQRAAPGSDKKVQSRG